MTGRDLLEELRRGLAPIARAVRTHRYLAAAPPEKSRRGARLLHAYELRFWDTLANAL